MQCLELSPVAISSLEYMTMSQVEFSMPAPAKLQRFQLRCLKFDITVKYKPRKAIPVSDALSRVCYKEEETVKHDIHFITTNSKT